MQKCSRDVITGKVETQQMKMNLTWMWPTQTDKIRWISLSLSFAHNLILFI